MWPRSKHSCSALMPSSFISVSSSMISLNGFAKTVSKTNVRREREYFA